MNSWPRAATSLLFLRRGRVRLPRRLSPLCPRRRTHCRQRPPPPPASLRNSPPTSCAKTTCDRRSGTDGRSWSTKRRSLLRPPGIWARRITSLFKPAGRDKRPEAAIVEYAGVTVDPLAGGMLFFGPQQFVGSQPLIRRGGHLDFPARSGRPRFTSTGHLLRSSAAG